MGGGRDGRSSYVAGCGYVLRQVGLGGLDVDHSHSIAEIGQSLGISRATPYRSLDRSESEADGERGALSLQR